MRYRFCLLATLLLAAPIQAQEFSIQQIMGAAFPSELVSTPGSGSVAWVQNARGARNIWVATAPAYEGRRITSYGDDDGQEITNLIVSPDGSHVIYVRGGAPNRQGEIPTPTSDPTWAKREIWIVASSGGDPVRLAEGASPALSPNGVTVAFVRNRQIWSVPVTGGDATQMFTMRGGAGDLRWSPDGQRLAFVSARGDHAFVGVYDTEAKTVTYMAPSVDRDVEPVWSPDGERVAFVRSPNVRDALPFEPRRTGHPWSIMVANIATGEAHAVWTAHAGPGSVFQGAAYSEHQLFWGMGGGADDRLVFPWEGNGWTNLYSVRASGTPDLQVLTPGQFEVEAVTMSPDGSTMVFSSNQADVDRRHIWRVAVRGGTPRAMTTGTNLEWAPVMLDDGAVAFLGSGPRTPLQARIIRGSENRVLDPHAVPSDFPAEAALVVPEAVVFSSADGLPIHAQLFRPSNVRPGEKRPALVFFHGGSRRQMLLGFHHGGYYHNAYSLNQYFASRGYVVLSVNYRSGIGYGLAFREALNYGARGASEFNDVMGAGLYLRSRPDVDPARIGLWGGSYGGYLTALGLARASDLFAAGVDLHGVHDWNVVVKGFIPSYNAQAQADWAELAYESSPMAHIDGWRSPVLVIHGDDDRNVPFSETVDLVESLRSRNVDVEQLIFPDEVHSFLLHRNWLAAYQAAANFFERRLRNSGPSTMGPMR
jgi:dipeptidyl aminopeptidase/acylaminoacyl peptidase